MTGDGELVLGIDLATAGARLLAVDVASGRVQASVEAPLPPPVVPAPGHLEQRPVYAEVVRALLRAATASLGARAAGVRALSVTATSGSVVAADAHGVPTGVALLYADQRGAALATRLSATTGHRVGAASTLARLAWLAGPDAAAPVPGRVYLHVPDVVVADLTGRLVTDTSHALKAGVDAAGLQWPGELLAAAAVPLTALPELVGPGTVVGVVRTDVARDVGLPPGVRVVAGMTDGCTAQLAAGAVAPGSSVGVLGTTLVLKGVSPTEVTGFAGAVYSHRAPDGSWWPGGASNTGAGVLAVDGGVPDLAAADAAADAAGPSRWTGYPLSGTGERFPFARPDATAFLLPPPGARTAHPTPHERHRTWLDGVAFVERLGLERLAELGVGSADHRVVGGGTRSRVWTTVRASVLGRPVTRPAEPSSAFGAALLAASACSGTALTATAVRLVRPAEVVEPDPRQTGALEEGYRRLLAELHRRGWLDDRSG
ncbi:FGGY family carbohydrate kinase [Modestobacter sp. VKM Ac-2986]|uniref:FGGY family carbohydrate kinase n=1 Tax=Modestobacter sp. VKM Ac-2986 TaxID=3004140 RepID=UPI0022AB5C80|nr:FGGY family carbohydrate kinase [Modestobacter sp. VKM Ac-2986]MCZ2830853.1 FGGY family carbohydrate kinase [Modestobacter sp. VKM Ac-2986]